MVLVMAESISHPREADRLNLIHAAGKQAPETTFHKKQGSGMGQAFDPVGYRMRRRRLLIVSSSKMPAEKSLMASTARAEASELPTHMPRSSQTWS
jgi:hypothetical protein